VYAAAVPTAGIILICDLAAIVVVAVIAVKAGW
jgi:hypothetical protein